ncbi:MAG: hypothetical protein KDA89_03840, partial [Planctomycetaceae bacterium]|nr:hypothetical protein [Planctomycetaceae bacterium]
MSASTNPNCRSGMISGATQQTAVVERIRQLARDTWAIRLRAPFLAANIIPGQFFMVRPVEGSDPLLGRPFALFDIYCDEAPGAADKSGAPVGVEFGFVTVGKLTSLMTKCQPGDEI